jgi:hypothetical protein
MNNLTNSGGNQNSLSLLGNYFMIKHDGSAAKRQQQQLARSSSKSNSAPSSPNMSSKKNNLTSSKSQEAALKNALKNATVSENKPKLRPSISSSSHMLNEAEAAGEKNKKANVKKKLAFSDEDILNDEKRGASCSNGSQQQRQSLKDKSVKKMNGKKGCESKEPVVEVKKVENEYQSMGDKTESTVKPDKRSMSLTKPVAAAQARSISSSNQKAVTSFDFKSIYEAFEKPIEDLSGKMSGNGLVKTDMKDYTAIQSLICSGAAAGNAKPGYNSLKYDHHQVHRRQASTSGRPQMENYIDREKIAAAAAAAEAAAAAIERDKEFMSKSSNSLERHNRHNYLSLSSSNNDMVMNVMPSPAATVASSANGQAAGVSGNTKPPITNFYTANKSQLENLPVISFFFSN